jgi:hypothetical protein
MEQYLDQIPGYLDALQTWLKTRTLPEYALLTSGVFHVIQWIVSKWRKSKIVKLKAANALLKNDLNIAQIRLTALPTSQPYAATSSVSEEAAHNLLTTAVNTSQATTSALQAQQSAHTKSVETLVTKLVDTINSSTAKGFEQQKAILDKAFAQLENANKLSVQKLDDQATANRTTLKEMAVFNTNALTDLGAGFKETLEGLINKVILREREGEQQGDSVRDLIVELNNRNLATIEYAIQQLGPIERSVTTEESEDADQD